MCTRSPTPGLRLLTRGSLQALVAHGLFQLLILCCPRSLSWFSSLGHTMCREVDEEVFAGQPDINSMQVTRSNLWSGNSHSSMSKFRQFSILKMKITNLKSGTLKMESSTDNF